MIEYDSLTLVPFNMIKDIIHHNAEMDCHNVRVQDKE